MPDHSTQSAGPVPGRRRSAVASTGSPPPVLVPPHSRDVGIGVEGGSENLAQRTVT